MWPYPLMTMLRPPWSQRNCSRGVSAGIYELGLGPDSNTARHGGSHLHVLCCGTLIELFVFLEGLYASKALPCASQHSHEDT